MNSQLNSFKRIRRYCLTFKNILTIIALLSILSISTHSMGQNDINSIYATEKIDTSKSYKIDVHIFNDTLIWYETKTIHSYNLQTMDEKVILENFTYVKTDFWDGKIVYQNDPSFFVSLFEIEKGVKLLFWNYPSYTIDSPAIYKDRIVLTGLSESEENIYQQNVFFYNMTSFEHRQLTNNTWVMETSPKIWEDYIVWTNNPEGIYLYNLKNSTGSLIINISKYPDKEGLGGSDIYKNFIVFNALFDIWLYDINTMITTRLTNDDYNQSNPGIWGNNVIWQDDRNGGNDIYFYNLDTKKEYRITYDKQYGIIGKASIYDDYIAWIGYDNRTSYSEIFLLNLKKDSDNDNIPDFYDNDDDNDSYTDEEELVAGTDPLDANSHPQGEPSFWENYGFSISIGAVFIFVIIIVILFRHKKSGIDNA